MTKTNDHQLSQLSVLAPFLGILLLFTVVSLLNIPVLTTLWRHGFDDGTYSHAFLIPFISLYLYYLLAQANKLQFRQSVALLPIVLLALSSYLLFVSSHAQISIGYWFSLLAVITSCILVLYRFNWYIIFPCAFLVFIIPSWGILVPILQQISVNAVTYMMTFTGIPTFVEDSFITIPAGVFEIAGGCSGLRYIIVAIAISTLFIFLYIKDTKKALLFFSIAIIGGLLTNWIRITALIMIGQYTDMQSPLMGDHNTFGWYLFLPFMFLLFFIGNKLANHEEALENSKDKADANAAKVNKSTVTIALAIVLFSATSNSLLNSGSNQVHMTTQNVAKFNKQSNLLPFITFYSERQVTSLTIGQTEFSKHVYYFDNNDLDNKPSYYDNKLYPESWQEVRSETLSENNNNWQLLLLKQNNKHALVAVQYQYIGQTFTNTRALKLARIKGALTGNSATELHWLVAQCQTDCQTEVEALSQSVMH